MNLNTNFGKLDNGIFAYAPRDLEYAGRTYVCCNSPDLYYAAGYRDVVEDKEERVGVTAVFDRATQEEDRYEEREDPETHEKWQELVYRGKIIRHYRYEPIPEPIPAPRVYSVEEIIYALGESGKLDGAKAVFGWMYDLLTMRETISADNEIFASQYPRIRAALVEAGVFESEAEVDAMLAEAEVGA